MNIVEIHDVIKMYPNFALKDISFSIRSGSIMGLIGENGAGKTTLISIILQQIKKDSGKILFMGESTEENLQLSKQDIGFVLDECCFPFCFNARDISAVMQHIYKKKWDGRLFNDYLENLGVDLNKTIEQMSKGTKNKLLLSVALAHKPKLLVLDEVTSGLDPVIRHDVLKILKNYVETFDASILFSTHTVSDLEKIADEFVFIHCGEIIFKCSTKDLSSQYGLLRCSTEEFSKLKNVIAYMKRERDICVLIKKNLEEECVTKNLETFNLEELMLILVKGERYVGTNQKGFNRN